MSSLRVSFTFLHARGLVLFFSPALFCLSAVVLLSSALGLAFALGTVALTGAGYVGLAVARTQVRKG